MRCESCGFENGAGNRFCGGCGSPLEHADSSEARPSTESLPATLGGGRYRTVRLLGEGARKRVYLAVDERLAREVAVAVVKLAGLDSGGRTRITREAQAMARLGDDPHIVTVFDVGEEADGTPFIVSQHMPGGSLDDVLAASPSGRLDVAEAIRLVEQLALGLAHAHALGIVHRDLKPANVWLDADGGARLGDFGLAANIEASRITTEGTVLGTVAYIAPEQALGREPEPRSDLYALGALAYELLCGRPPFLGDDAVSVISQHLNSTPVSLRFHNESVPEVLETLVLRLLAKDPQRRPASASEVVELLRTARSGAGPVAPTSPSPAVSSRPVAGADWGRFVGRESELDALHGAFDEAAGGRTQIVMVVGEPGIGKTRTVEELGVYASVRGAQVVWGRSYEGEIGVSYLPFVEALRAFVRELSLDGELLDPASGCAEVATIVPELRDLYPQLPVLPPLDGDAERHRLFDGVAAFVSAMTRIRPIVIVLDDLHWSDKPTLLLLAHLARRIRHARLAIVGTYRDVELERSHPLAETIAALRREHLYQRVLLRGLPLDEVRALIEVVGGQETPGEFADLIFRETEGNPFFVAEILRHLVESGAIRHEGGAWIGTPDVAENLPEGVREVIGRRLDSLSPDANTALTVAASMPGGFTIDVVGDVAGLDEDTMLDLLDEALAAQVVRERKERPGTYEFSHALIRQTLYGELSTPRRVRMHRRVGEVLERQFADSIETHLTELAYHAYEAAPGGDVDKAVEFARRAGDRAMAQAAYEEAVRSYEMAVQALDLVGDEEPRRRAALLLALGDARQRAGDAPGCEAASFEAAGIAQSIPDALLLARAAVVLTGSNWWARATVDDPRRDRLYEEAEAALDATPPDRERDIALAAVLARHATTLALRDPARYKPTVERAVETARRTGDAASLAGALQSAAALYRTDEERGPLLSELLDAAERADDIDLSQYTRQALLNRAMANQERDEVDRQLAAFVAGAARSRVAEHLAHSLQLQGSLAAVDGRYDEAERLMLESAELARTLGVRAVLNSVGIALAPVYRELGRLAEFEEPTRRVVEQSDILAWKAGLVQVLLEAGKIDEARTLVDKMADQGLDAANVFRRYTLAMLVEAAAATGAESLTTLDDWMRSDPEGPGRSVILGANAYHGAYDRFLGLAAGALGRHDEAVALHEAALDQHEGMRAPGWVARSRFDLAGALIARAGSGDHERAGSLLNQAVEDANRLGMTRLVGQALAAKLELQGVPVSAPVNASIDLVSATVTIERPRLGDHADADGQVTICFSDIVGYSSLTERLGDHRTHDALRQHNELLRRELVSHRGAEVKSEGDGFMLAFREPRDALRFAAAFQQSLRTHPWPDDIGHLDVRMGIHRGAVIRDADDFFGRTVIVGARVASSASGGEVLVTEEVRQMADDHFMFGESRDLQLKGLSTPQAASRLLWS